MSSYRTSNKKLIFVISGPSGSGKTTLLKGLLEDLTLKNRLTRSISFTTRPRRSGERDKEDYFFITHQEFRQRARAKKILEWTRFLNYYYGTPKEHFEGLLKKNKYIVLCLDEKGAFKLRRLFGKRVVTIFILPPRLTSLKKRMSSSERKTNRQDLLMRLFAARSQLRFSKRYDYRIINDDFSASLKRLKELILKEIASQGGY